MRSLLVLAPFLLLACGGGGDTHAVTQGDAGVHDALALTFPDAHDAGHPRDAARDAEHDALSAPTCTTPYDASALDGGPLTVTVVTAAHLVQATPFVDATATIPPGCWSSVVVRLEATSECTGVPPAGQNWPATCDPYDRLAQVTLGDALSLPDAGPVPLFLVDAVTSFGGTATWNQDVTDYVGLLTGTHTYHLEIDTYADSTGMATGTASSHDATLTIVLTPGNPPHDVALAVPLLRQDITATTPSLSTTLTAPHGATSGRLDFFTSGHGANGPQMECDEFCEKVNDVSVDGTNLYAKSPESSCAANCNEVDAGQTFMCGGESFGYFCKQNPTSCPSSAVAPRSNWCPSQIIAPIPLALPTSALTGEHTFGVTVVGVDGTWPVGLSAVYYR
jgi:hypothetical protein